MRYQACNTGNKKENSDHRNDKIQIFSNEPVNLGLSILEISKIVIYEFWYDHMKPKHVQKTKLCLEYELVVCILQNAKVL